MNMRQWISSNDLRQAVVLLGISLGAALAVNFFSPSGISLVGQWDPDAGVLMANTREAAQAEMAGEINNPLTLRRMIENQEILLIDARPESVFDQGHLPGAVNYPFYSIDDTLDTVTSQISGDRPVVVYCSGVACQDSHGLAKRLMATGIKNIQVYAGGFDEWQEMGFEVVINAG